MRTFDTSDLSCTLTRKQEVSNFARGFAGGRGDRGALIEPRSLKKRITYMPRLLLNTCTAFCVCVLIELGSCLLAPNVSRTVYLFVFTVLTHLTNDAHCVGDYTSSHYIRKVSIR